MPTQSIDLSTVSTANFNGTELSAINLNGTEIWNANSGLFVQIEETPNTPAGFVDSSGYTNGDDMQFRADRSSSRGLALRNYGGEIYIGSSVYNPDAGDTNLASQVGTTVPSSTAGFLGFDYGSFTHSNSQGWQSHVFAKVTRENGFVPVGPASGSHTWVQRTCVATDTYGSCIQYDDVSVTASFSITATSFTYRGTTWTINLSNGNIGGTIMGSTSSEALIFNIPAQ